MAQKSSFIIALLLFFSCAITEQRITGFTKEYSVTAERLLFLSTIKIERKLKTSGWFVTLTHKNKKSLNLFVPNTNNNSKLDVFNIINEVELSNNPNDWSFYYCIFGAISIDTITNNTGEKLACNFYQTIIEQNRPFIQQMKKVKGYSVEFFYTNSASFCLASVEIPEINKYNSVIRIQDGRPVNTIPNPPFFVFDEKDKRMNILLAKSDLCY